MFQKCEKPPAIPLKTLFALQCRFAFWVDSSEFFVEAVNVLDVLLQEVPLQAMPIDSFDHRLQEFSKALDDLLQLLIERIAHSRLDTSVMPRHCPFLKSYGD